MNEQSGMRKREKNEKYLIWCIQAEQEVWWPLTRAETWIFFLYCIVTLATDQYWCDLSTSVATNTIWIKALKWTHNEGLLVSFTCSPH